MVPVGPILSENYPQLDGRYRKFLDTHDKTVYIALGTHIALPGADLTKVLQGLILALDAEHINGVIWSVGPSPRKEFDRSKRLERLNGSSILIGDILNGEHQDFMFPSFAPQRAILEHSSSRLYLTHGGGSSANEALFHGTPVLVMGFFFDQLCNSSRLVEAGVGLAMDKFDFASREMADKIGHIVTDADGRIKRNVERMKRIAKSASRRKHLAIDVMEEVIYDHKLRFRDGKELRPMHLQTADMRMSIWKARNWDLWAVSLSVVAVGGIVCFIGAKHVRQLDFGVFKYATDMISQVHGK